MFHMLLWSCWNSSSTDPSFSLRKKECELCRARPLLAQTSQGLRQPLCLYLVKLGGSARSGKTTGQDGRAPGSGSGLSLAHSMIVGELLNILFLICKTGITVKTTYNHNDSNDKLLWYWPCSRHYSNCFTNTTLFNPYNNPMKQVGFFWKWTF